MSNNTLKSIGWWCLILSIIALISWGGHSCNKWQDAKREAKRVAEEKEVLQKLLTDKYLYMDINGVYHIKHDCYRLDDCYWDADENKVKTNYSSQYISRRQITNWHKFAATHQLCSYCFSPELIQQLDSVNMDYYRDADEEDYYLDNSVEKVEVVIEAN